MEEYIESRLSLSKNLKQSFYLQNNTYNNTYCSLTKENKWGYNIPIDTNIYKIKIRGLFIQNIEEIHNISLCIWAGDLAINEIPLSFLLCINGNKDKIKYYESENSYFLNFNHDFFFNDWLYTSYSNEQPIKIFLTNVCEPVINNSIFFVKILLDKCYNNDCNNDNMTKIEYFVNHIYFTTIEENNTSQVLITKNLQHCIIVQTKKENINSICYDCPKYSIDYGDLILMNYSGILIDIYGKQITDNATVFTYNNKEWDTHCHDGDINTTFLDCERITIDRKNINEALLVYFINTTKVVYNNGKITLLK